MAGLLAALAVLAASGCSDADPVEPGPEPVARDECSDYFPADAEVRHRTLAGATDGEIQAVEFPSADAHTALVLLPERGGGVCGWGAFAHAASSEGFASIVVAPCGYGASTCTSEGDADPVNEVAPAITAAREDLGVDRVVLMGASMGGSLAVLAAAGGADVDAWIDVSGPPSWEESALEPLAGRLPAGGLVVFARSDGALAYRAAQRLARRSGARFLDGGSGHGYQLLSHLGGGINRTGRAVLAHAKG